MLKHKLTVNRYPFKVNELHKSKYPEAIALQLKRQVYKWQIGKGQIVNLSYLPFASFAPYLYAHTCVPSVQFLHISISERERIRA